VLRIHFVPKKQNPKAMKWMNIRDGATNRPVRWFVLRYLDSSGDLDDLDIVHGKFMGKGALVTWEYGVCFRAVINHRCKHSTILVAIQDKSWSTLCILCHELTHFIIYSFFNWKRAHWFLDYKWKWWITRKRR